MSVIESFLEIMYEGGIINRVRTMIEDLFAIHKSRFQDFPPQISELDLFAEGGCKIHEVTIDDELEIQESGAHIFGRYRSFMNYDKTK